VVLAALLFVTVPKQGRLLKVIGISCVIMVVAGLLLFVRMAGNWRLGRESSPGAVYSDPSEFLP
jgi:hypothetical protein